MTYAKKLSFPLETFCSTKNKLKKPFVSPSFISHIITAALLAQAIKALNGADVNLFCHDTSSKQGQSIFFLFFLICFSTYFTNQNIYLKKTCSQLKAAKGNHLSSRRVEICLGKICSLRCRFVQN